MSDRIAFRVRAAMPRGPFVLPLLALLWVVAPPARAADPALALVPVRGPESVAADPPNLSAYLAHSDALAYQRSVLNAQPLTMNEQSYNVRYYDLDLHPDPVAKVLSGTVRTVATVVSGPITTFDLDLDNTHMTVDAATSASLPAAFSQGGGVLTLQLDRAYNTGETVDVTVRYHGTPAAGAFGAAFVFTSHNGKPFISSLSEPFDAHTWWPCKDDASDKADSVDVRVTVPSGMTTASNGRLVESSDNGVTAYTHWHEKHPIATYLVSVASHAYSVVTDWYHPTSTDSMEIRFHLFPESVGPTAAVEAKVKTMIGAFAACFGPYPFQDEKYGHAQILWSGGMENETCTSLGSFGEYTVAHELSHQWWGDAITCRDFHHVWLNEGFATFSEAMWAEAQGGISAYHANMNAKTYYGNGTVYVPDVTDPARIFDFSLSYEKGSWVLHMLRHLMGDTAFFAALRSYLQQHYFGNGVTEDFQAACEAASGMNLSKFFQQWVYGEYYPAYQTFSTWRTTAGGGYDVTLQLTQTQPWQVFWMPVDVRVTTGSGSYDFVARDSTTQQSFTFHVPDAPTSVALDPDQWVLRTIATLTAVETPAAATTLELSVPYPNPLFGDAAISFRTPGQGDVELDVLDAAGRRVARLEHGVMPAGPHQIGWNGRGDGGRALAPGVYWLNLEFQGERRARRFAIAN